MLRDGVGVTSWLREGSLMTRHLKEVGALRSERKVLIVQGRREESGRAPRERVLANSEFTEEGCVFGVEGGWDLIGFVGQGLKRERRNNIS